MKALIKVNKKLKCNCLESFSSLCLSKLRDGKGLKSDLGYS